MHGEHLSTELICLQFTIPKVHVCWCLKANICQSLLWPIVISACSVAVRYTREPAMEDICPVVLCEHNRLSFVLLPCWSSYTFCRWSKPLFKIEIYLLPDQTNSLSVLLSAAGLPCEDFSLLKLQYKHHPWVLDRSSHFIKHTIFFFSNLYSKKFVLVHPHSAFCDFFSPPSTLYTTPEMWTSKRGGLSLVVLTLLGRSGQESSLASL